MLLLKAAINPDGRAGTAESKRALGPAAVATQSVDIFRRAIVGMSADGRELSQGRPTPAANALKAAE